MLWAPLVSAATLRPPKMQLRSEAASPLSKTIGADETPDLKGAGLVLPAVGASFGHSTGHGGLLLGQRQRLCQRGIQLWGAAVLGWVLAWVPRVKKVGKEPPEAA